MKCAWCGLELETTRKNRPKQHRNGTTTCVGSGQERAIHERLRAAAAAAHKQK
jgi:hypothetical protein